MGPDGGRSQKERHAYAGRNNGFFNPGEGVNDSCRCCPSPKDARDFISNLNDVKRHRQVTNKLLALTAEAFHGDAEALQGEEFSGYYRTDMGEYRIIYGYVEATDIVSVYVIGKRDGEEAHKEFKRKLKSM